MKKIVGWLVAAVLAVGAVNALQDPHKADHIGRTTGHLIHKGSVAVGNGANAAATAVDAATGGK